MEFSNNFSITNLFITKKIKIVIDNKQSIFIKAPSIKDFYENDNWNATYHLWTLSVKEWQELLKYNFNDTYSFIKMMIFNLGQFKEYNNIAIMFQEQLNFLFNKVELDWQEKEIKIDDITITSEIWDYFIYILKLTCGEKVSEPLTFNSPEAKALYEKQKALEDKIKKIKGSKTESNKEGLMKVILSIIYSFPALSIDYLFEQTMAQIHWLQTYAAGAVSYEINAKAYAAGNMKKDKKVEFFIK